MPEAEAVSASPPETAEQKARAYFQKSRGLVPPPESAPEPASAPQATEAAPEPAESATAPAEATAEPQGEQDDAVTVETLSDLAEALGVEVAELHNIKVPVTSADGTRADVTLGEWKDAYQSSEVARKRAAELDSLRAKVEQEQRAFAEQATARLKQTEALLNAAERQLVHEFESTDWNTLRESDPAEWAARRQLFVERQNQINAAKQQAVATSQQLTEEQAEKAKAQKVDVLRRESELLQLAVPEWKDETKAKAEQAELFDYLVSAGFSDSDVANVTNHRVVVLARKAMLFDRMHKQAETAKKKLVKVASKVMKPGAAQSKAQQNADAQAQLVARLKKTGSDADAFALLKARRFGK